jgi:hypothetical protein
MGRAGFAGQEPPRNMVPTNRLREEPTSPLHTAAAGVWFEHRKSPAWERGEVWLAIHIEELAA